VRHRQEKKPIFQAFELGAGHFSFLATLGDMIYSSLKPNKPTPIKYKIQIKPFFVKRIKSETFVKIALR
jgi:hypothetical protein